MESTIQQFHNERTPSTNLLILTVICSIFIHIVIISSFPNIKFETTKRPEVLTIELVPPIKSKPEPAPTVEPKKPAKSISPSKLIKKIPENPLSKPVAAPRNPEVEPPSNDPLRETQSQVIYASPKPEDTQTFNAPVAVPEPSKPKGPSEADLNAARVQYAETLRREVARDKKYPSIAATRGYQGDVLLDVKLDSNGNVLLATVRNSSTYESLDKEAVAKIYRISPFPLPPEVFRGHNFNVIVPISFKLE